MVAVIILLRVVLRFIFLRSNLGQFALLLIDSRLRSVVLLIALLVVREEVVLLFLFLLVLVSSFADVDLKFHFLAVIICLVKCFVEFQVVATIECLFDSLLLNIEHLMEVGRHSGMLFWLLCGLRLSFGLVSSLRQLRLLLLLITDRLVSGLDLSGIDKTLVGFGLPLKLLDNFRDAIELAHHVLIHVGAELGRAHVIEDIFHLSDEVRHIQLKVVERHEILVIAGSAFAHQVLQVIRHWNLVSAMFEG